MLHTRRLRSWLFAALLILGCFLPLPLLTHRAGAAELVDLNAPCSTSVMHVIQPGETLSGIAVQFGVPEGVITTANGLANPNLIYGGQPILVPTCGTAPAALPSAPVPAAGATLIQHVVQAGETIWSLSVQYGVSQADIAQANGLANANIIYGGQSLLIPTAASQSTAVSPSVTPATVSQPTAGTPAAAPATVSQPAAVAPVAPTPPPAQAPVAPAPAASAPAAVPAATSGKRIEVNLSTQQMYAYDGHQLFVSSGVSTGRNGWETPPGNYAVYEKLPIQTMTGHAKGISWVVPNVPNVMYFFGSDALHGTYWHNRFGTGDRLSHGCVNLPLGVAAQLYAWAPVGTPVWVHY